MNPDAPPSDAGATARLDPNPHGREPVRRVTPDGWADFLLGLGMIGLGGWILARNPARPNLPPAGFELFRAANETGWALVVCGVAALAARALDHLAREARSMAPTRPRGTSRTEAPLTLAVPLTMAAYFLLSRIVATKTALIGGERYFWLDDDAMISLRYALNLAAGYGLVWNAGEPPVEGYTNFLWTLLLAAPHALGVPLRLTSAAPLAGNALLLALILWRIERLGARWGLRPGVRWVALLLVAGNRWTIFWAAGGSEMLLLALMTLLIAEAMTLARRHKPLGVGFGILLGSLEWVRADGLILTLAFLPGLLTLKRTGRARRSLFVAAALVLGGHFLGRYAYYGAWLPNTYTLKVVDFPMKVAHGVAYARFLFWFWGGIMALHLVSMRVHRHPMIGWVGLVVWARVAYVALVGGDELPEMRFLVPVVPLAALGAMAAADQIFIGRTSGPRRGFRSAIGLPGAYGWVMLAVAVGAAESLCLPPVIAALGQTRGREERRNVEIGLLIKRNTAPQATVAHFWAGAAPYFSERPAQDMLGKSDRRIARLPGRHDQWKPGHVKYDTAYSMSLRPDVLVSALPQSHLDPARRAADGMRPHYPALYDLYDHPTFQKDYAAGLVPLPLSADYHALFVRRGSALARPPEAWVGLAPKPPAAP